MNGMRVASFFAGAGGLDLGFKNQGFDIVYAIIANGVIPTLRYYLRLIRNPAEIFPAYTELLKSDKAISHEHGVTWNDIVLRSDPKSES